MNELRPFLLNNQKWRCKFCSFYSKTEEQSGFVQHLVLKHANKVDLHEKDLTLPKQEDVIYFGDVSKFDLDLITYDVIGDVLTIEGQSRHPNDKGEHKIITRHVDIPKAFMNANLDQMVVGDRLYVYKIDKESTPEADQPLNLGK